MRKCVYCKSQYQKGNGLSFHRFPTDDTKYLWLENMKGLNCIPTEWNALCSKHFEPDCFNKHYNRTSLRTGSVPTIFNGNCEDTSSASSSSVGVIKPKSPQPHGTKRQPIEIISEHIQPQEDKSSASFSRVDVSPQRHRTKRQLIKIVSEDIQPQEDSDSSMLSNEETIDTEIKIEIEELPPFKANYPYSHDMSSASSSSVGVIRPKSPQPHCTNRKPSEIILENIRPQKDSRIVKSQEKRQISIRPDHEYGTSKKTLLKKKLIILKKILPQTDSRTVKSEKNSISKEAEKECHNAIRPDHQYELLKKTFEKKYVMHDHSYDKTVRSSWEAQKRAKQALKVSQTRVKVLLQHVKRLKTKVSNLKSVIKVLNKKNKDPDACCTHMLTQYDDFKIELFHRMLKNARNKKYTNDEYPPQLRGFAMTLYLYSTKAYAYVRKQFNLALPHPRIIRHWCSTGRKS